MTKYVLNSKNISYINNRIVTKSTTRFNKISASINSDQFIQTHVFVYFLRNKITLIQKIVYSKNNRFIIKPSNTNKLSGN